MGLRRQASPEHKRQTRHSDQSSSPQLRLCPPNGLSLHGQRVTWPKGNTPPPQPRPLHCNWSASSLARTKPARLATPPDPPRGRGSSRNSLTRWTGCPCSLRGHPAHPEQFATPRLVALFSSPSSPKEMQMHPYLSLICYSVIGHGLAIVKKTHQIGLLYPMEALMWYNRARFKRST